MKTYLELEEIGIISTFQHEDVLHIIVKGGDVYRYWPAIFKFSHTYTL